jgi:hypothetical protein
MPDTPCVPLSQTIDSDMAAKSQITQQSYLNTTNLEDELDFRLRQLVKSGDDDFGRETTNEFDILEDKDRVFGEDFGWECGIW